MSVRLVGIFGGFTSPFGHVSAFVEESPNASICPTKSPPLNRGESFSLDIRYDLFHMLQIICRNDAIRISSLSEIKKINQYLLSLLR